MNNISECPFLAADESGIEVLRPLNLCQRRFALKMVALLLNACFW